MKGIVMSDVEQSNESRPLKGIISASGSVTGLLTVLAYAISVFSPPNADIGSMIGALLLAPLAIALLIFVIAVTGGLVGVILGFIVIVTGLNFVLAALVGGVIGVIMGLVSMAIQTLTRLLSMPKTLGVLINAFLGIVIGLIAGNVAIILIADGDPSNDEIFLICLGLAGTATAFIAMSDKIESGDEIPHRSIWKVFGRVVKAPVMKAGDMMGRDL